MRISDWSSDVCSSDLDCAADPDAARDIDRAAEAADLEPRRILAGINAAADDGAVDYEAEIGAGSGDGADGDVAVGGADPHGGRFAERADHRRAFVGILDTVVVFVLVVLVIVLRRDRQDDRSEEHTSELQALIRISYAVFFLN